MQSNGLDWTKMISNVGTDTGWQNCAEFGQTWRFTLSMVKQVGSTQDVPKALLKYGGYYYVWAN